MTNLVYKKVPKNRSSLLDYLHCRVTLFVTKTNCFSEATIVPALANKPLRITWAKV